MGPNLYADGPVLSVAVIHFLVEDITSGRED